MTMAKKKKANIDLTLVKPKREQIPFTITFGNNDMEVNFSVDMN